jgi:hypothetical protein
MTPEWDLFIAWWNANYADYISLNPSHRGIAWDAWKAAKNVSDAPTPLEVELGVASLTLDDDEPK